MRKAAHARAISLNQPMTDTARRSDEQVAKESNDMNNIVTNTQTQGSSNTTSTLNQSGQTSLDTATAATATALPRQVPESVDEVLQVLKTTFPLLILSLETMVDQIHQKFKPPPEEDIYRHIYLLLGDAISVRVLIGVNLST